MSSIIEGYNYDIYISYRQKDNKGDRWVSEFVDALKDELDSTFKEEISVYFDINPHDGLSATHDVDASLKEKLKCLVFIPIISRTYCDPKSFAWEHEFEAFIKQASGDKFGLKVTLPMGNVTNRVLPVRIHDLDSTDIRLFESTFGGLLRSIDFVYKETGVNRQLRQKDDDVIKSPLQIFYRDQLNKVSLAIKDIIESMKEPGSGKSSDREIQTDITEMQGRFNLHEVKKHNLPINRTSFIGREKEIHKVKSMFNHSHLVTLAGAGGCGKTRLAGEIALTLIDEYRDGVWFIDLSPITDPNLVSKEISKVLNIKEESNNPIIETLISGIKNKSLLLLLDNCEHLVQTCAEIADRLLRSVNGLRILATSREILNIPGEVVWRIPSLSFPDPEMKIGIDQIIRYEAIRLFTDRAGSSLPGFNLNSQNVSVVSHICYRMEGIPLAIELAATRLRHLGLDDMMERLDGQFKILSFSSRVAPDRQQTLKATIDWSYNLLSEQEKLLFRRLSVFTGDYNLEAIEQVCSDEQIRKENIIPLLSQLVDKSLVIAEKQADESFRYRCLMPLYQYIWQKLIESGDEEKLRKSHLLYFKKIAEESYEEHLESQLKWVNKLEQEHSNLIAALNWSEENSPEEFVSISGALAWFWRMHSHILLGRSFLEKALSKENGKSESYARALFGMGLILNETGIINRNRVINLMNESLSIWRNLNNQQEEATVLSEFSFPYASVGDHETGLKCSEQSLEIARRIGKPGLVNHCLGCVCLSLVFSKKFDLARPLVEELLISSEKLQQPFGIEASRHFYGDCALENGNFTEAEKRYSQSIETALKYGDNWVVTADLQGVAMAVSGQSRWAKSIRLDAAAREKARVMGTTLSGLFKFWDEWIDTYIGCARERLGEELTRKYEEEGKNMGFESAVEYALNFEKD